MPAVKTKISATTVRGAGKKAIAKGKPAPKKTVGGRGARGARSVPPPASKIVTTPFDVSEVVSADPAVKKAAVVNLSALPAADLREMCGERGIEIANLKSKAMMNVSIIEHEETLVVMYTAPEVGSAAVTPQKGKGLRQSKGLHGSAQGARGGGTQFDKLSEQSVITKGFARDWGDAMDTWKYDREVLGAYSADLLKSLYSYVGRVLDA